MPSVPFNTGMRNELIPSAKREEAHRKHKSDKRNETMRESVRKVEEKNAEKAMAAAAAAETADDSNA
jgi:small subunit ribosomal protein S16